MPPLHYYTFMMMYAFIYFFIYVASLSISLTGMWHSINVGESDDNLERVFQDGIDWILRRS